MVEDPAQPQAGNRDLPRLLLILVLVGALHFAGAYGLRWARNYNRQWLHPMSSSELLMAPPADALLAKESADYLATTCGVTHAEPCRFWGEESPTIQQLRETGEIGPVNTLLSSNISVGPLLTNSSPTSSPSTMTPLRRLFPLTQDLPRHGGLRRDSSVSQRIGTYCRPLPIQQLAVIAMRSPNSCFSIR